MLGTGTGVLVLVVCVLAIGAAGGYAFGRDGKQVVRACYRVTPTDGCGQRAAARDRRRRDLQEHRAAAGVEIRGPPGPAGPGDRPAPPDPRVPRVRPGAAGPAGPPGASGSSVDCDLERRIAKAVP